MKITMLTVGQTEKNWIKEGLDVYVSRLKHYCAFSVNEIPELKNVSSLSREQIRKKEGELVLKAVRDSDEVILLDEHGKEYSSTGFAEARERPIALGGTDIAIVSGGAYGCSEEHYRRSQSSISL